MRLRWLVVAGLAGALAACGQPKESSDVDAHSADAAASADGANPSPDTAGVATQAHAVTPPAVDDDSQPPPQQEAKP